MRELLSSPRISCNWNDAIAARLTFRPRESSPSACRPAGNRNMLLRLPAPSRCSSSTIRRTYRYRACRCKPRSSLVPMRQIHVRAGIAESELDYLHPRNAEAFAQCNDLFGDQPKILGDHRQFAEFFAQHLKKSSFGPFTQRPLIAVSSSAGISQIGFKAAEMIDAHDVARLQRPLHPLDPPVVAARRKHIPTVKRISPALSVFAEVIGRNSRHHFRGEIFVQTENIRMRPDIGAVVTDEDSGVANDENSAPLAFFDAMRATVRRKRTG